MDRRVAAAKASAALQEHLLTCAVRKFPAALVLGLSTIVGRSVHAQQLSFEATAGWAIPGGVMAERRYPAARWAAAVGIDDRDSGWSARFELARARFPGRPAPARGQPRYGDYSTTSFLAHLAYGRRAGRVRPAVHIGLGAHSPSIPDQPNPYGRVAGVAAGVEVGVRVGRATIVFGARSDAILSDYGHGDFQIPTFRTLVGGVRF
jgi:hypothetical protein